MDLQHCVVAASNECSRPTPRKTVTPRLDGSVRHELEQLRQQLERVTLEVSVLREQLERDWLTGLYNRRFVANELNRNQSSWFVSPISIAVIDVDHFKSINDTYGHGIGDQVLSGLAELMHDAARASDVLVRAGGEEFLLVMPTTDNDSALAVSERIRSEIQSRSWDEIAVGLIVTVSVGVAATERLTDFDELVSIADANLYAAKRSGRNCVVSG
jgi:diguanylate cyclase (GGDEF)-like protein